MNYYFPSPDPDEHCESIVPVRIDMECFGHKVKDRILWNLNDNTVRPDTFAEIMCGDLNLPPAASLNIARSIRNQLDIFRQFTTKYSDARRPCCVRLEIPIISSGLNSVLVDMFEWDPSMSGLVSPEKFAQQLCADIGIGGQYPAMIAFEIREKLFQNLKDTVHTKNERTKRIELDGPVQTIRDAEDCHAWSPVILDSSDASEIRKTRMTAERSSKTIWENKNKERETTKIKRSAPNMGEVDTANIVTDGRSRKRTRTRKDRDMVDSDEISKLVDEDSDKPRMNYESSDASKITYQRGTKGPESVSQWGSSLDGLPIKDRMHAQSVRPVYPRVGYPLHAVPQWSIHTPAAPYDPSIDHIEASASPRICIRKKDDLQNALIFPSALAAARFLGVPINQVETAAEMSGRRRYIDNYAVTYVDEEVDLNRALAKTQVYARSQMAQEPFICARKVVGPRNWVFDIHDPVPDDSKKIKEFFQARRNR
eukprot:UC4_evm2s990